MADISVRNATRQSLDQVTIVWDRQELRCGLVSAGGLARVYEAGIPKGATSQVALITFVEDRTRHPRTIVVDTSPLTKQSGSYQATFAIKSLTNAEVIVAPKPW
jgi:hypothetical protein